MLVRSSLRVGNPRAPYRQQVELSGLLDWRALTTEKKTDLSQIFKLEDGRVQTYMAVQRVGTQHYTAN
jgi:hypothetical protein